MNSPPDFLPYPYTKNTGPASTTFMVITGVVTLGLLVAAYFGKVTWLVAAMPAIALALRFWLFSLIFNAVHLGLRASDMDLTLDELVIKEMEQQAKRTLTPGFMTEALLRDSEEGTVH